MAIDRIITLAPADTAKYKELEAEAKAANTAFLQLKTRLWCNYKPVGPLGGTDVTHHYEYDFIMNEKEGHIVITKQLRN